MKKTKRKKRKKTDRSKNNYFKTILFFWLVFYSGLGLAQESADSQVSLEVGGDSNERRYFRPCLRFSFPVGSGEFFMGMDYLQRINSDLRGEVDFWLSAGYLKPISKYFSLDAGIHHLCRHKTSREYPVVLDINEFFARFWYKRERLNIGFGSGTFLGFSNGYEHIMVFNLGVPQLFGSEFSGKTEIKLIDLEEILYDLEIACALNPSLELFLRCTQHYQYPETVYMGLRIKDERDTSSHLDKLKFKAGIIPFKNKYKMVGSHEFKLDFLETVKSRVLIIMSGKIPVLWRQGFIGPYPPEKIIYPLSLQYEKRLGSAFFAAGYFRYHISMPMDVGERFSSDLGVGLALRNQRDFDKLENRIRFEVFAGKNFSHRIDTGVRLGWNSGGRKWDYGSNVEMTWNPDQWYSSAEVFVEWGDEVKIRPFIGIQRTVITSDHHSVFNKFLFGMMFMQWY